MINSQFEESSEPNPERFEEPFDEERQPLLLSPATARSNELHRYDSIHTPSLSSIDSQEYLLDEIPSEDSKDGRIVSKTFISVIVSLLAFILGNAVFIHLTINESINDSLVYEIDSLNITQLHQSGANIDIKGSIMFNYTQITNTYRQFLMRQISGLGIITLWPTTTIPILLSIDDSTIDHVLNLDVSGEEFKINLQHGFASQLHCSCNVDVIPAASANLINKLLENNNELSDIKLKLNFQTEFKSSYLDLKSVNVDREFELEINKSKLIQRIISEISIGESTFDTIEDNSILANTSLLIPGSSLLKLVQFKHIPSMNFNIEIPGCLHNTSYFLSNLLVTQFDLIPGNESIVPLSFQIPMIDENLSTSCKNDVSPIAKTVKSFFNNDTINFIISGQTSSNRNLPRWLSRLVKKLKLKFELPVSKIELPLPNRPLSSFTVASIESEIEDGLLSISSYFNAEVNLPDQIRRLPGFRIDSIWGIVSIFNNDIEVAEFNVDKLSAGSFKLHSFTGSMRDSTVVIDDYNKTADLVQRVLNEEAVEMSFHANLSTCLRSEFVNTTLRSVTTNHSISFNSTSPSKLIGRFRPKLNTMSLLDSAESRLEVLIDLGIQNPFDIAIDNSIVSKFGLNFNGSDIGYITLDQFQIDSTNDFSNFTSTIVLEVHNEMERIVIDEMVGRLASGLTPKITLFGKRDSIDNSPSLSKLLSQLSFNLELPQIDSPIGDDGEVKLSREKLETPHKSMFLLDSTMHIMTSDMQLTVFNPIDNQEVIIEILEGKASHDGATLGYISKPQVLVIPPGVYHTPRIPISYAGSGIGADILRAALNGNLEVDSYALMKIYIGSFEMEILYQGSGVDTKIRL